jgi:hypothetical protein
MMLDVHPVMSTTPTQYALGVCFLILGPAFAIAAALVQWRRRENVAFGMIAAGGASWLGWIVSCAVAVVLFPRYPVSGAPPEPVAMLFALPGLAAGAVVLRWLASRRDATRGSPRLFRTAGALLVVISGVLAFALVAIHVGITTWPARRELPASAVIVTEEAFEDTFLGDFTYDISARMSREEFRAWMQRLGLRATSDDRLEYEREGSNPQACGASGQYRDGIGRFSSWCS